MWLTGFVEIEMRRSKFQMTRSFYVLISVAYVILLLSDPKGPNFQYKSMPKPCPILSFAVGGYGHIEVYTDLTPQCTDILVVPVLNNNEHIRNLLHLTIENRYHKITCIFQLFSP